MMKYIFTILITLFSLVLTVQLIPVTHAQSEQQLVVAVTPYRPSQNLDFFFLNSAHPLQYIEDANETPVFLAIITPEQQKAYTNAGYKPVIVDDNAGEISQYYILSGHNHNVKNLASQLQKPEYKQQGVETAYQLSQYYTLIKLSTSVAYTKLNIPELHDVHPRRLQWNLIPNADKTSTQVQKALPSSPTTHAYVTAAPHASQNTAWIFSAFVVLGVISIFCFTVFKNRRQG